MDEAVVEVSAIQDVSTSFLTGTNVNLIPNVSQAATGPYTLTIRWGFAIDDIFVTSVTSTIKVEIIDCGIYFNPDRIIQAQSILIGAQKTLILPSILTDSILDGSEAFPDSCGSMSVVLQDQNGDQIPEARASIPAA